MSALATVGARLPGEIARSRRRALRGVESAGMLCSARELGLAETSEGILELPADAPLGADLRALPAISTTAMLEVNVTPNRGDAHVGARHGARGGGAHGCGAAHTALAAWVPTRHRPRRQAYRGSRCDSQPESGCRALARLRAAGVDNSRASPLWLRERLRRSGVRSISPVVDVTNYVMLELGQPMHAYDLAQLHGGLSARRARAGEQLRTARWARARARSGVLVIADERVPVGLAGVMGGQSTADQRRYTDVALEVAWFDPAAVAGRARRFGLQTDASQRFERGVDWRGRSGRWSAARR